MSIIYEALLKTQRNRQNRNDINNAIQKHFDIFDWALILIIGILLLAVIFLIYSHASDKRMSEMAISPQTTTLSHALPATEQSIPGNIINASANLTLNGVLMSDNEKIALINSQPFHKGDMVGGMLVVSIELNKVILQKGSEFVVLRNAS